MIWTRTRLIARLRCCTMWKRSNTIFALGEKLFSQVIVKAKHIHRNDFDLTANGFIVAQKVISDDSLCPAFKDSDDIEIVKILHNETHLLLSKGVLVPGHNLRQTRKIRLKVKVIGFANDSWWTISVIEVFSINFWAMIALETTLFKKDSDRHTSWFKVRNLRRFWSSYVSFDFHNQGKMELRNPA